MSRYVFKLPDLGEGTVEAEIVAWHVKPGDVVAEEDVIVEVMTEKASVEMPSPVSGRVVATSGAPGDMVPVGSELIVFETDTGAATSAPAAAAAPATTASAAPAPARPAAPPPAESKSKPTQPAAVSQAASAVAAAPSLKSETSARNGGVSDGSTSRSTNGAANGHARAGRVATSPAIRRRAHEAGVDLTQLAGSGPNGRILREDFEAFVSSRSGPKLVRSRPIELRSANEPETEEIKVIGIRRVIAQRMSEAKRNIPHFAYVEEIDVTELESLRRHLNSKIAKGEPSLTYLPFIASALVRVLHDFPQCNALYDSERNVIIRHRSVHLGVATQTPDGLKVPVVHDAQSLGLSDLAAEMRRVTEAARTNKASRDELSGSTITLTSLGKLGGIASTPIINAPEVSIIGINRAVERPMVHDGAITIRRMMNLSSSFDHRFVDGFDAAAMIQALKERIEHPATIFID